jgi:hypothetical protein
VSDPRATGETTEEAITRLRSERFAAAFAASEHGPAAIHDDEGRVLAVIVQQLEPIDPEDP